MRAKKYLEYTILGISAYSKYLSFFLDMFKTTIPSLQSIACTVFMSILEIDNVPSMVFIFNSKKCRYSKHGFHFQLWKMKLFQVWFSLSILEDENHPEKNHLIFQVCFFFPEKDEQKIQKGQHPQFLIRSTSSRPAPPKWTPAAATRCTTQQPMAARSCATTS